MADFVAGWVRRFETLAGLDCDVTEIARLRFDLVDDIRRDACEKQRNCDEVATSSKPWRMTPRSPLRMRLKRATSASAFVTPPCSVEGPTFFAGLIKT